MDEFLAIVGVQAMKYAVRSGIALTSTFAMRQCSRLLHLIPDAGRRQDLEILRHSFESRIKVVSPAIDLIEFKSGRSNPCLESAVPLANSLHREIVSIAQRLEQIAVSFEGPSSNNFSADGAQRIFQNVTDAIKSLMDRIDREVPLLQLAITASGESLATSLPPSISPSRLLQASTLLIIGDTQHSQTPTRLTQVGPTFTFSLYMLFVAHSESANGGHLPKLFDGEAPELPYSLEETGRRPLWQEVIHKARVRLVRKPWSSTMPTRSEHDNTLEYTYNIDIEESFEDGRAHCEEDSALSEAAIDTLPVHDVVPLQEVSKIFYVDTSTILNIDRDKNSGSNPILLFKRDARSHMGLGNLDDESSVPKQTHMSKTLDSKQEEGNCQLFLENQVPEGRSNKQGEKSVTEREPLQHTRRLPTHLDPEWIAFEMYTEDAEDAEDVDEPDSNDASTPDGTSPARLQATHSSSSSPLLLLSQMSELSTAPTSRRIDANTKRETSQNTDTEGILQTSPFQGVTSSLSLLEMMIRLAGLQEVQQASHLTIPDHVLSFFLDETSTTGLAGEEQRKARREAKLRTGFDPYTDSHVGSVPR